MLGLLDILLGSSRRGSRSSPGSSS